MQANNSSNNSLERLNKHLTLQHKCYTNNQNAETEMKKWRIITTGPWTGSEAMNSSTSELDHEVRGLSRLVKLE